eukprot:Rhum_TRINITY_DN4540_c0_g1::Rhum_TRINITY_DN4540_c0_g1_i1::g.14604::m.14604/K02873/RP-L13e, RPL13; large subunit ribosomal protein L13e
MPKHNNAIPRNHFHKHWNPCSSQKGHVKTFFQQAKQKKARRVRRLQKAKDVYPRPVAGPLRPVVQACSVRYNMKQRMGRGFTLDELKAAGLSARYARTIGIAVDHRRKNHSEESLNTNAQRLKDYVAKLVLYPLKQGKKATKGPVVEATKEQLASVQQNTDRVLQPVETKEAHEAPRALSGDEKKRNIYNYLRAQLRNEKFVGIRLHRIKRREAAKDKDAVKVAKGKK